MSEPKGRDVRRKIPPSVLAMGNSSAQQSGATTRLRAQPLAPPVTYPAAEVAFELIENANDIIFTHDLAGRFTYVNRAGLQATGYNRQEILRLHFTDVVAPEYVPLVRARIQAKLDGDLETRPYPVQLVAKDGRRLAVDVSARLVFHQGTPTGIQGIARDVTDRKQAEAALRESEGKFRALSETASSAIFIYQGSKFLYVNAASENITGYSRQELLHMNLWELVHPEFREVLNQRGLALQRGEPVPEHFEFKLLTKGGQEKWVHFSAAAIPFNGGLALLGTAFDISENKRSSEELLLQKAYLEQLFECAPEGIVVRDNSGRILRANREFCRMFGYEPGEVARQRLDDLIVPEDKLDEAASLTRFGSAGGRFNIETVRRRKDGALVDVSILGTPVQVESGQVAVYVIYRDITEGKRGEQALIESEAKFRAVADTAASAIYIHTAGRFLYVNRASEAISGYTREELLGMRPFSLVHPDHRAVLRDRFRQRQQGSQATDRYEFKIIAKNGEVRWLDFSASRIQFSGQFAVLATAFDVTERKRAEQLQSLLYHIAERANAAEDLQEFYAAVHGILAELLYAKNFYVALYDAEKNLLSWPYFVDEQDHAPPQPRSPRKGLTEYVLHTGQPLLASPEVFDGLVERGEVEPLGAPSIDWLGVPLKIGERTFGVLVAQSYDRKFRYGRREQEILTFVSQHVASAIEHKREQEALRESEERYRSLFERAAYGIYRTDMEGGFVTVNPALVRMLGYDSAEEVLRLKVRDAYLDPNDRARIIDEFHREGRSVHETRWRRKDGRSIIVRLTGRTSLNRQGIMDGYEVIVEDVTERRALEEQLQHSQKLDAVGRLAGGVAHDFNNLLTVIKGYSELMLSQFQEADPMRGQMDEIRKAADRAATLTRQLLAFSRRQMLAPKVLDLNIIVSNMDRLLRRLLGEDVELLVMPAADLGHIKADPGQIEQVIMNLAVNARDAMPQGGQLVIETANLALDQAYPLQGTAVKPGRYVVLTVSDTGHGMSEDIRSRIFEPFFTTKEKGTGLGLSTVYGIVKQSGGYIWVYSEPGRGASFKVYLPRVDEAPDIPSFRSPDDSPYRGTETILLLEDEDGVRALVRQMLQQHGYKVLEASNAGEALILCERHRGPLHLLVTDVVLTQISGPEIAKRLLALRPDMRVLYMSGYTEDAIVQHGVLRPGIEFVQKPFTAQLLASKVRAVLDQPR
ncbi:MAG: PAS domain S-box protein [Terriglobales bacterium]